MAEEKYLNIDDITTLTSIADYTLLRAIKSKNLKAQKVGRNYVITQTDLNDYLNTKFNTTDTKKIKALLTATTKH